MLHAKFATERALAVNKHVNGKGDRSHAGCTNHDPVFGRNECLPASPLPGLRRSDLGRLLMVLVLVHVQQQPSMAGMPPSHTRASSLMLSLPSPYPISTSPPSLAAARWE